MKHKIVTTMSRKELEDELVMLRIKDTNSGELIQECLCLAHSVSRLNTTNEEVGAGMLANLVSTANRCIALHEEPRAGVRLYQTY